VSGQSQAWFTSDLHFGHANVIKYSRRPFADVDDMDAALIDNWCRVVGRGDRVYVLGDLTFRTPAETCAILDRLPGQKFLILGNHCRVDTNKWQDVARRFVWVRPYEEIKIEEQKIVLFHYAMRVWNRSHHGSWHLYGHSHGSLQEDHFARSTDVGVDAVAARLAMGKRLASVPTDREDYRPISFAEVGEIMACRNWRPVDHHGVIDEDERIVDDLVRAHARPETPSRPLPRNGSTADEESGA
jgi:calcineurin-like phosphoesterase family protein